MTDDKELVERVMRATAGFHSGSETAARAAIAECFRLRLAPAAEGGWIMTTPKLPTRDDGGIDWDRIKHDPWGCYFYDPEKKTSWGPLDFARQAAAHERDRCARAYVSYPAPSNELDDYRRGYHDGASDLADAIRKMEA